MSDTEKDTKLTIEKAVKRAYNKMPTEFYAIDLIAKTRQYLGTSPFDTTILRKLRLIRQKDFQNFGWKCIDIKTAKYKKTTLC